MDGNLLSLLYLACAGILFATDVAGQTSTAAPAVQAHVTACAHNAMSLKLSAGGGGDLYVKQANGSLGCATAVPDGDDAEINLVYTECGVPVVYFYPYAYTTLAHAVHKAAGGHTTEFSLTCSYKTMVDLSGHNASIDSSSWGGSSHHSPPTDGAVASAFGGAEAGEPVPLDTHMNFTLSLADDAYSAIRPETCYFANSADSGESTKAYFVKSGCPFEFAIKEISTMKRVDEKSYDIEFRAFTVGEESTMLHISCAVRLCVQAADCDKACWHDGTAAATTTAAPQRRRKRAADFVADREEADSAMETISRTLHILDMLRADKQQTGNQCSWAQRNNGALTAVAVVSAALILSLSLCATVFAVCYMRRRGEARLQEKVFYQSAPAGLVQQAPPPAVYNPKR